MGPRVAVGGPHAHPPAAVTSLIARLGALLATLLTRPLTLTLALVVTLVVTMSPVLVVNAPAAAAPGKPGRIHSTADAPPAAATGAALGLTLTSVSPAVATPGQPVTVTVRVQNAGTVPLTGVQVGVSLGRGAVIGSDELNAAPTEASRSSQRPAGQAAVPTPIAAGSSALVSVPLAAPTFPGKPYGLVTMSITASGSTLAAAEASASSRASAVTDSFLPYIRRKEFIPLRLGVLAPLTPDPDPALVSADAPTQAAAWTSATSRRARVPRILAGVAAASTATRPLPITLAVDPTLVGASGVGEPLPADAAETGGGGGADGADGAGYEASGSAAAAGSTPGGSGSPTAAPSASTAPTANTSNTANTGPDAEARAAISAAQRRIGDALTPLKASSRLWRLPTGDPDISALVGAKTSVSREATRVLTRALRTHADTPALPGSLPEVLWPADGLPSADARRDLAAALPATSRAAALIAPISALDDDLANNQGNARRTLSDGTVVLADDPSLSAAFEQATRSGDQGGAVQLFLARSMTLLDQRPGVARSVLVSLPRTWSPDPAAVATLTGAVGAAAWLTPVKTDDLLADTPDTVEEINTASPQVTPSSTPAAEAQSTSRDGLVSPLSPAAIAQIDSWDGELRGIAKVLPPDDPSVTTPLLARNAALASTRWRTTPAQSSTGGYALLRESLATQVVELANSVRVQASDVNFFAETGALQVTVVNTLPVAVHDVRLQMTVSDGGRLRISEQPPVLIIRANSRVTVKVPVEAIAAGLVPVSATLLTPDGTRLGSQTTVHVQVQPTNGWLVLAIGGLALVVFLVGLLRAVRRGRSRMSSVDAATASLVDLDGTSPRPQEKPAP